MKPTLTDIPDVSAPPVMAAPRVGGISKPSRLNDFYELTKPRMNLLVVITTMIGYYMAGGDTHNWHLLFATLIGTMLSASGASVLNQYVERDIDPLMPRTRNRPLAARRIGATEALVFGIVLALGGMATLQFWVNPLTAGLSAVTVLTYLGIYTPLKRYSWLNTIVGAVPGAIPPMMGCTAVHGQFNAAALALFAILFVWQMPHFFAIALMFRDDYIAGGFKMLPCVDNERFDATVRQILLFGLLLIPVSLVPTIVHLSGWWYFAAAIVLGLWFFSYGVKVARTRTRADARKLFFASIIYLPLLLAVMLMNRK